MTSLVHQPMAVLFDMDGVIVNSDIAHQLSWKVFGELRLGMAITLETFNRCIRGRKNEDFLAELFPGRFTPEELVQISDEKEVFYREKFGPTLEVVPGVQTLIKELNAAPIGIVRIALATSAPPENAEFILTRFGISDAFPVRVNGSQVAKAKPDPAIYLEAARQCEVVARRCVVLEDAVAGVMAAKRAGMQCLAVTTSDSEEHLRQAGADSVYPDFTQVDLSTLQELVNR